MIRGYIARFRLVQDVGSAEITLKYQSALYIVNHRLLLLNSKCCSRGSVVNRSGPNFPVNVTSASALPFASKGGNLRHGHRSSRQQLT
jgi:hypothetical protein